MNYCDHLGSPRLGCATCGLIFEANAEMQSCNSHAANEPQAAQQRGHMLNANDPSHLNSDSSIIQGKDLFRYFTLNADLRDFAVLFRDEKSDRAVVTVHGVGAAGQVKNPC
jgi:hypothetical protein